MKLEFPNITHKEMHERAIQEWSFIEETPTSPGKLFQGESFEEFLQIVSDERYPEKLESGRVSAHLFLLVDNGEIVGAIQIRHHINHPNLVEKWGHIGYGIAPKFRRKGYGSKMLQLALEEAKNLKLDKVLITCDIDNTGSNKIIQKNDWVFERITKCETINRYWITL